MSASAVGPEATILVTDDEPANVLLLQWLLGRNAEWRVEGVTRSAEVMERFREVGPDLVLLDLRMPAPDGFTLLRSLREEVGEQEYLPVLVLTADLAREVRERALELGASDFLTKPLDATEVMLRTRNLLQTRMLHRRVAGEQERLEAQVRERTRALEAAEAASRAKDQFLGGNGPAAAAGGDRHGPGDRARATGRDLPALRADRQPRYAAARRSGWRVDHRAPHV